MRLRQTDLTNSTYGELSTYSTDNDTSPSENTSSNSIDTTLTVGPVESSSSYESDTMKVYKCADCGNTHIVADSGSRGCGSRRCEGRSNPIRKARAGDFMNERSCRPSMYEGDLVPHIGEVEAAYVIWMNDGGALRYAVNDLEVELDRFDIDEDSRAGVVEHTIRSHFAHLDPP